MSFTRLERLEAQFPSGGLWERFVDEMNVIPNRSKVAMRRLLRGHPDRLPLPTDDIARAASKRLVEHELAGLSPAAWRDAALRLGESWVDELAAHELAEPACPQCKGMQPIREVV